MLEPNTAAKNQSQKPRAKDLKEGWKDCNRILYGQSSRNIKTSKIIAQSLSMNFVTNWLISTNWRVINNATNLNESYLRYGGAILWPFKPHQ